MPELTRREAVCALTVTLAAPALPAAAALPAVALAPAEEALGITRLLYLDGLGIGDRQIEGYAALLDIPGNGAPSRRVLDLFVGLFRDGELLGHVWWEHDHADGPADPSRSLAREASRIARQEAPSWGPNEMGAFIRSWPEAELAALPFASGDTDAGRFANMRLLRTRTVFQGRPRLPMRFVRIGRTKSLLTA